MIQKLEARRWGGVRAEPTDEDAVTGDRILEAGAGPNSVAMPFFAKVRLAELEQAENAIHRYAGRPCRLLEVGAGAGWQAWSLSQRGYDVEAIDIPESNPASNHARTRVWPITDYDGSEIPFPDNSFDAVFSSNVLEHVQQLEILDRDIERVLRPGGHAIHFVPTPTWRAASFLSHYPAFFRDIAKRLMGKAPAPSTAAALDAPTTSGESNMAKLLRRSVPRRHGAEGTTLGELRRFSRASWDVFFARRGWSVVEYAGNDMFLSGDTIFGEKMPLAVRRRIARAVGGTAHLYVLKRPAA